MSLSNLISGKTAQEQQQLLDEAFEKDPSMKERYIRLHQDACLALRRFGNATKAYNRLCLDGWGISEGEFRVEFRVAYYAVCGEFLNPKDYLKLTQTRKKYSPPRKRGGRRYGNPRTGRVAISFDS